MVNYSHPRKFGYDVAYARTLFAGEGRESSVSSSGGGVCYKSCDAFVQHAFFLAGNRARNGVANVVAFISLVTGEGKRQNEFAEWHNYAESNIHRMTQGH